MPNDGGRGVGLGPGGECVCQNCGHKEPRRVPCYQQTCPKCGSKMIRSR